MTWRRSFGRSLRRLLLLLSVAGCSSEDRATGAPLLDGSADAADGADADAAELRAGYSRVALPWRVGAKPGQVGTNEADSYLSFVGAAVSEILPILQRTEPDPTPIIREITAWVLQKIEEQVNATMPGTYARIFQPGRGIELPPDVKALVVERGGEKVALVRADLYIMHEQLQRRVAELVEERTGIGRDRLFLVATHNHSVPHSVSPAAGVWILADAFDPRQFVYVAERIAQAIIEANDRLEPAELRVSRQEFRDAQRNVIGPGTSEVENPDGVLETVEVGYPRNYFDPDLMMLRFDRPNGGASIASLFLFGMHPESLTPGHGITSGEWPSHVELALEQRTGTPFVWMPGPLGDSEPDDGANHPDHVFFRGGFETMATMVNIIADATEQAYMAAGREPGDPRPRFAQLARDIPGTADYPLPTSEYLGPRYPMLRLIEDSAVYRLHIVRLGDVLLLGAPAEITTDLSLNIKSRVDADGGNVHQGYVYPEAPEWVRSRIAQNFATTELDAAEGAPLPMIVSHAGGYMGYIVTAWEYTSHSHYREDMTALGPGTADHIASAFVGMARELAGGEPYAVTLPPWHEVDLEGVQQIGALLQSLQARVTVMQRALPASDPANVGMVLSQPANPAAAAMPVTFGWQGGTNDHEPPRVVLERDAGGTWETVEEGPSGALWVLFEPPDRWSVEWKRADASAGSSLRFRVEGTYRGAQGGTSPSDPIWDPDGANQTYSVTSAAFSVQ